MELLNKAFPTLLEPEVRRRAQHYYKLNRERIIAYQMQYWQSHREKYKIYQRQYWRYYRPPKKYCHAKPLNEPIEIIDVYDFD